MGRLTAGAGEIGLEVPRRYAGFSAGASARRLVKAWDEDKFARLAVWIHERWSLAPVLVGAGDTRQSNELISRGIAALSLNKAVPVCDLTGSIGLRALVALLKGAELFVGIDSGVMHLASAVDIPVVALFGPTDPELVGPQNERSAVVRLDLPCSPCYLKRTCSNVECMRHLRAEDVMDACIRLLEGSRA